MKWSSHKKITGKIAKYFGIPYTKEITEASILPDKEYDYRLVKVKKHGKKYEKKVRLRHHLEPFVIGKIIDYTKEARRKKVRGDKNFVIPLGKASHYIQDNVIDPRKKVLFIFKRKDKKRHDWIEARIDKLDLPFEEVHKVRDMQFTLSDFERELKKRKPSMDPEEALRNAMFLTAMVIKLVQSPEYPESFFRSYKRWKTVTVLALLGGIGAVIAGYFLGSLQLMVGGVGVAIVFMINPMFWKKRRDKLFLDGKV